MRRARDLGLAGTVLGPLPGLRPLPRSGAAARPQTPHQPQRKEGGGIQATV